MQHALLGPIFALGLASASLAQQELFELHPAVPQVNVRFGEAVDSEGDFLVVGCPWETNGGVDAGVAYVYDFPSGTELHRLAPSDGTKWDVFGQDVAIGGGLVVVGAYQHDAQGAESGAAYVFDLASGAELGKLVAPDGQAKWWFGYDVAVDEDHIVVGAPIVDGAWDGQVYVFDAQTLAHTQTIVPAKNLTYNPGFGAGVAIDDGYVAVGCLYDGRAWVHDASSGALLAEVAGDGGAYYGYYGRTLELDGEHLLVGAHIDYSQAPAGGAAYFYHWPSQTRVFKSTPSVLRWHEYYGSSLALTPDWVLVGAPRHMRKPVAVFGEYGNGALWILDRATGFEIKKVEASDGAELDYYGASVTANDTHFAVGAKLDDDMLENSGSVYIHELPTRVGVNYCTPAVPNSTGQPARIEALGSSTISAETLVLVARQVPINKLGLFLVSATSANVPGAGGGQGTLCLGGQIARFGAQVTSSGTLGALRAEVDVMELPLPLGNTIQPGETWNFQAWYRDKNPTGTSNFTDAVAVTFN